MSVYDSPNEDEKLQNYVFYESVFLRFHSKNVSRWCNSERSLDRNRITRFFRRVPQNCTNVHHRTEIESLFQWPITDEIFSKVERITNTDSDPSTSSLPPYNAIPFDTVTVQGSAQAQKERTYILYLGLMHRKIVIYGIGS